MKKSLQNVCTKLKCSNKNYFSFKFILTVVIAVLVLKNSFFKSVEYTREVLQSLNSKQVGRPLTLKIVAVHQKNSKVVLI